MGLKVEIPIVDCYGRDLTGYTIEVSDCNLSLIHFKLININGEGVDRFLKREDLAKIAQIF